MTTIQTISPQLIHDKDSLRSKFDGCGATANHIGAEAEFFICQNTGENFATPSTISQIVDHMATKGHAVQTEACGVIELNTNPVSINDTDKLYAAFQHAEADLKTAVNASGHVILETAVPPFISIASAERTVVPRERILNMIASVKKLLPPDALRVGLLTASCQVSIDYQDVDDLYRKTHRGYALSPILLSLLATDTGRLEGKRLPSHIRSSLYSAYGPQETGIPNYFRDCQDGEQLVDTHIAHVSRAPLLYYYEGDNVIYPEHMTETFNSLAQSGNNTERNFEVAESFLYHDIKLKPLPNGKRRLEFRLVDSGQGNTQAATALIETLVCHDTTARLFDDVLKEFGFRGTLSDDAALFTANRQHALENPGNLNVQFGNGRLRDLVKALSRRIIPALDRVSQTRDILDAILDENRVPRTTLYRALPDHELKTSIIAPA